ncbi:MAG TPA: hypothetical protein VG711_05715 [Phycisphaerales bacterium]|nr:hypothetical protein [Phycisphaerales bacterium]
MSKVRLLAGISDEKSRDEDVSAGKFAAGLLLCGVALWMLAASASAAEGTRGTVHQIKSYGTPTTMADEQGDNGDSDGNHSDTQPALTGNDLGTSGPSAGGQSPDELLNLPPLPIVQPLPYKILVAEKPSSTVKQKYASHKAGDIVVFYTQDIDPGNVGAFNAQGQAKLTGEVNSFVPDVHYKGLIVLDWEGAAYQNLIANPGSQMQKSTMAEYIKATQFVRQMRPQAKVSVYGVPPARYWNRDESWVALAESVKPLIQQLDCLCPSIYDFYANAQNDDFAEANKAYAKDNARLALQMAEGRPVYPFVWPRYHDSNQSWGMRLIPRSEFKALVTAMAQAEVDGRYINGVVWWGDDKMLRYVYHHPPEDETSAEYANWKKIKKLFKKEIPSDVSESKFFNDTHTLVLKDLKTSLMTIPEPPAE